MGEEEVVESNHNDRADYHHHHHDHDHDNLSDHVERRLEIEKGEEDDHVDMNEDLTEEKDENVLVGSSDPGENGKGDDLEGEDVVKAAKEKETQFDHSHSRLNDNEEEGAQEDHYKANQEKEDDDSHTVTNNAIRPIPGVTSIIPPLTGDIDSDDGDIGSFITTNPSTHTPNTTHRQEISKTQNSTQLHSSRPNLRPPLSPSFSSVALESSSFVNGNGNGNLTSKSKGFDLGLLPPPPSTRKDSTSFSGFPDGQHHRGGEQDDFGSFGGDDGDWNDVSLAGDIDGDIGGDGDDDDGGWTTMPTMPTILAGSETQSKDSQLRDRQGQSHLDDPTGGQRDIDERPTTMSMSWNRPALRTSWGTSLNESGEGWGGGWGREPPERLSDADEDSNEESEDGERKVHEEDDENDDNPGRREKRQEEGVEDAEVVEIVGRRTDNSTWSDEKDPYRSPSLIQSHVRKSQSQSDEEVTENDQGDIGISSQSAQSVISQTRPQNGTRIDGDYPKIDSGTDSRTVEHAATSHRDEEHTAFEAVEAERGRGYKQTEDLRSPDIEGLQARDGSTDRQGEMDGCGAVAGDGSESHDDKEGVKSDAGAHGPRRSQENSSTIQAASPQPNEDSEKNDEVAPTVSDPTATSTTTPSSATQVTHTLGVGPSMLSQVISQTRPTHLPPKSKEEDQSHLESWKRIMEDSLAAEKKREAQAEASRKEKEDKLVHSLPIWNRIVAEMNKDKAGVIDWHKRVDEDPKLKNLWMDGVPSHLRGKVWATCIGNDLALPRESFKHYLGRAKRAIANGRFPEKARATIEEDSRSALHITKLFVEGSPLADDLRDLLQAWVVSRSEEGLGYMQDVHWLAAMLLVNMDTSVAFIALRNLLERPTLRAFFRADTAEVEAYYRVSWTWSSRSRSVASTDNMNLPLPFILRKGIRISGK